MNCPRCNKVLSEKCKPDISVIPLEENVAIYPRKIFVNVVHSFVCKPCCIVVNEGEVKEYEASNNSHDQK